MSEWFEDWFGTDYLEMYPHRDEKDAAELVSLISRMVPLQKGRVLDLACGPGRHSDLLRERGANVVGIDLSLSLLQRAREDYSPPLSVVRGDMRCLPFADSGFEAVINLFTSFGYFEADEEHRLVLREIRRIVKEGGWFVLDFLNASHVVESLVKREEQTLDGRPVAIERWISDDGRFVFKEMSLRDEDKRFVERVRLFSPKDLEHLLIEAGFSIMDSFGDYSGRVISSDSPRAIVMAVRQ